MSISGRLSGRPRVHSAAWLASLLVAVGLAGWLTIAARAQGDDVLTYQLSIGVPNVNGEGGDSGNGLGQFVHPFGLAIDSTGRFIVTDAYESLDQDGDGNFPEIGNRIQIFAPDGALEYVIGADGTTFSYPTSVALDALGQLIVTDNDNNRILVLSLLRDLADADNDSETQEVVGHEFRAAFGTFGNFDPLSAPGDETYEPFDPVTGPCATGTTPCDRFNWPAGVSVKPGTRLLDPTDTNGRVAIVDTGNHRVVVLKNALNAQLQPILEPILQFGGHPPDDNPAGYFEYPWSVVFDAGGQIYVADTDNYRVQVFDENGNFLWTFGATYAANGAPSSGDLSRPSGLAFDGSGRLLVSDTDRSRVLRIDISSPLEGVITLPSCSNVSASREQQACHITTSDGSSGTERFRALVLGGELSGVNRFLYPQGVATDAQDRVAVVDTNQHIVRVFQPARIQIESATASADPGVTVGQPVTLTVTVSNHGGSALPVTLDVTASLAGTLTGDLSQDIPEDEQRQFDLTFTPDQDGDLTFTVEAEGLHVSGARVVATPVTTTPSIDVDRRLEPSLLAEIEADRTFVGVGEQIRVSVALSNTGNTTFTEISPVVTFSRSIVFPQPEPALGGPLVPGELRTLVYVFDANEEGEVSFTVEARAQYPDGESTRYYPAEPEPPVTATIDEPVHISQDIVPPVTDLVFPDPDGLNGWYTEPFKVRLTAVDEGSGVQSLSYRLEGLYSATTSEPSVEIDIFSEGETVLTYWATDATGNVAAARTAFYRIDSIRPTAGQALVAPAPNAAGWHKTAVTVQGVGGDGGSGVALASTVIVTTEGVNVVPLEVRDVAGNVTTTTVTVKIDKTAPAVSCQTLGIGSLWPPNHKLVPWVTSVAVSDPGGSGPAGFLLSATSSEPDDGHGDGHTTKDIVGFTVGTPDTYGFVRAERSGRGSGRVYTLVYAASDVAGNVAPCTVVATVPHDRGREDDDHNADDGDHTGKGKDHKKPSDKAKDAKGKKK